MLGSVQTLPASCDVGIDTDDATHVEEGEVERVGACADGHFWF